MPYLNIDDGLDEHPDVEELSDAAYRQLCRDMLAWSRTGAATPFVQTLVDGGRLRRAPRHWLPTSIQPPLRHRRKIPTSLRAAVYKRDGYRCLHCGASEPLSLDHIVPYSVGGEDTLENLQTLCRPCNSRKGARV